MTFCNVAFLAPINVSAVDKLRLLRRLDRFRRWESLEDERQCIQCGEIIKGRDIEVVGGTRESGPLRLQCPTENCRAIPMDWILLSDVGPRQPNEFNDYSPPHAPERKTWLQRFLRVRN